MTASPAIGASRTDSIADSPAITKHAPQAQTGFDYDVAIVGLGYVGLPTALAHHVSGAKVLGFDASSARLEAIRRGEVDLLPSDHLRLGYAMGSSRLVLSQDPAQLSKAAAVIVCVPTPVDEHQVPDLSILSAASRTVVDHAVRGQLIMMTSTTYAGCTRDMVAEQLIKKGLLPGEDVNVAFSPERINPGVADFTIEDVPAWWVAIRRPAARRQSRCCPATPDRCTAPATWKSLRWPSCWRTPSAR